jgi:hypothetical protein
MMKRYLSDPEQFTPPVTLVVRLLVAEAIEGHIVGHAEVVRSGEIVPICDGRELERLAQRLAEEALTLRRQPPERRAVDGSAQLPDLRASPGPARPPDGQ